MQIDQNINKYPGNNIPTHNTIVIYTSLHEYFSPSFPPPRAFISCFLRNKRKNFPIQTFSFLKHEEKLFGFFFFQLEGTIFDNQMSRISFGKLKCSFKSRFQSLPYPYQKNVNRKKKIITQKKESYGHEKMRG